MADREADTRLTDALAMVERHQDIISYLRSKRDLKQRASWKALLDIVDALEGGDSDRNP